MVQSGIGRVMIETLLYKVLYNTEKIHVSATVTVMDMKQGAAGAD